jgi:hypothetical protein
VRGEIWLGDAVRALARMAPADETETAAVMRALGFAASRPPSSGSARRWDREPTEAGEPADGDTPPPSDSDSRGTGGTAAGAGAYDDVDLSVLPLLTPAASVPPERTGWGASPTLERVEERHLAGNRVLAPLLPPSSEPATLQVIVSTEICDGSPLVDEVVRMLAARQPLRSLPREARRTLGRGADVLIDVGAAMSPFRSDERHVIDVLCRWVGDEAVRVRRFSECPSRGTGDGPVWTWGPYEPPPPATPVLLLTDFGIGGPAHHPQRAYRDEWELFLDLLERRGCPVSALVPYPPERQPCWARERMTLLTWDRSTTAGHAYALLDGGRRRSR